MSLDWLRCIFRSVAGINYVAQTGQRGDSTKKTVYLIMKSLNIFSKEAKQRKWTTQFGISTHLILLLLRSVVLYNMSFDVVE